MSPLSASSPLGLVLFGGGLPKSLACTLSEAGVDFYCVGFEGITDHSLKTYPHTFTSFLKVGSMLKALRSAHCKKIILVGQVFRPNLFKLRFDITTLKYLPLLLFTRSHGDDAVLRRVTAAFEREGFEVVSLKDIAPMLVAQEGQMGKLIPTQSMQSDIAQGLTILHDLGRHDVGQSLVIDKGRVIAIEAAEGTDEMLQRVKSLRATGRYPSAKRSGILVKASKPQQELRNDMPVVGVHTARHAIDAGLSAIAFESGRVMTADLLDMISLADQNDLVVLGVKAQGAHE
jgi:DUF1009 family protein